jgi:hypothetical protein
MSGTDYLVDTNILIHLGNGEGSDYRLPAKQNCLCFIHL